MKRFVIFIVLCLTVLASASNYQGDSITVNPGEKRVSLLVRLFDTGVPDTAHAIGDLRYKYIRVEWDNDVTDSGWVGLTALGLGLTSDFTSNRAFEVAEGFYRLDPSDAVWVYGARSATIIVDDEGVGADIEPVSVHVDFDYTGQRRIFSFVDTDTGQDSTNNGRSWSSPLLTVSQALARGATVIAIRTPNAGNAWQSAGGIVINDEEIPRVVRVSGIVSGGSLERERLPVICRGDPIDSASFSATGGQSITFEAAWTDTETTSSVFPTNPELLTVTPNNGGELILTAQASIANVEANPGSYYLDGGNDLLYVSLPDSATDYFTNGGDVAILVDSANPEGVIVESGNELYLENCIVYGGIRVTDGGILHLKNVESWFGTTSGLYISDAGTIDGENVKVYYAKDDGVSAHGMASIKIDDLLVGHVGTDDDDQCLTGHEYCSINVTNAVLYDASGDVVTFVEGSYLTLDRFTIDSPGSDDSGLRFDGDSIGLISNGTVRSSSIGLDIRANSSPLWREDTRISLNKVFFSSNSTDLKVVDSIQSSVRLEDCVYGTVSSGNSNFTTISNLISTDGRVTTTRSGRR